MNAILVQAITERHRLEIVYNGTTRLVEPQCYGQGHSGNELLRVHQIRGGSQPEPLFVVGKIERLTLLDEHFTTPGPNYRRGDSAMRHIYCEL